MSKQLREYIAMQTQEKQITIVARPSIVVTLDGEEHQVRKPRR